MKNLIPLFTALAVATPLYAEPVTPSIVVASPMSEGVVRKIDAANGRLTLRHGPIANLDMPPMTMVFRVQSPELLNAIKVGDTVKFHAEKINGVFTVRTIQVVP
jgi:Cu/Ag efflux protein CusF